MAQVIKVTLVHSSTGRPQKQKLTVAALGLRKVGQVRELADNVAVRGMIRAVAHLVRVEPVR